MGDGGGRVGVSLGAGGAVSVTDGAGVSPGSVEGGVGVVETGIGVGVSLTGTTVSAGVWVGLGVAVPSCNWAVRAQPSKVMAKSVNSPYWIRFDINFLVDSVRNVLRG